MCLVSALSRRSCAGDSTAVSAMLNCHHHAWHYMLLTEWAMVTRCILLRRLCPISLQVMRRPVLPSSGQAYDEVNIARFAAAGKAQCPVSGAPLECHRRGPSKGKVMLTPDYALRNVIRHQAQQAKVRAMLRSFSAL